MGWNASSQREFVVNNLGPTLEANNYGEVKLLIFDDQRVLAPKWAREVIFIEICYDGLRFFPYKRFGETELFI